MSQTTKDGVVCDKTHYVCSYYYLCIIKNLILLSLSLSPSLSRTTHTHTHTYTHTHTHTHIYIYIYIYIYICVCVCVCVSYFSTFVKDHITFLFMISCFFFLSISRATSNIDHTKTTISLHLIYNLFCSLCH